MELLDALVRDHGLLGLVLGFLVLGPGYTLVRTRNMRLELAGEAQRMLNDYMREEMMRGDALAERLQQASAQLDAAHQDIYGLKLQLAHAQFQLEEWGDLRDEVIRLRERVVELESQIAAQQAKNQDLRMQVEAREARIVELERLLPKQTEHNNENR